MKTLKQISLKKRFLYLVLLLILITLIVFALPQVFNPKPAYQTKLEYGKPLPIHIQNILTPTEKPDRIRSIMVLKDEKIVYEYGPTDKIMFGASTRKSFLSLLYGIAIEKGLIDINKTLDELGIDENPSLTDQEKTAIIRDLLLFKSGIYLPAEGEHDNQITDRPLRDSHKPGSYFFSNNFDADALGTIFIQETGYSIGKFIEEFLAKPLGMQDFNSDNVIMGSPWFWPGSNSKHKMYNMYFSTRDFAKIGALVANDGKWNNVQVVSKNWIKESTKPHSDLSKSDIDYSHSRYDAFGYTWWIDTRTGTIWTDGYGGHFMLIDPVRNLTLVERNFTGNSLLSTGLWFINKNMDQSVSSLIKAHQQIVQDLDKNRNK